MNWQRFSNPQARREQLNFQVLSGRRSILGKKPAPDIAAISTLDGEWISSSNDIEQEWQRFLILTGRRPGLPSVGGEDE